MCMVEVKYICYNVFKNRKKFSMHSCVLSIPMPTMQKIGHVKLPTSLLSPHKYYVRNKFYHKYTQNTEPARVLYLLQMTACCNSLYALIVNTYPIHANPRVIVTHKLNNPCSFVWIIAGIHKMLQIIAIIMSAGNIAYKNNFWNDNKKQHSH